MNIGYKRLQKPLNRALYLLELHSLALEEGQIHVDPEFLMEVREGTSQFFLISCSRFFPVSYWSKVN